MKTTFPAVCVVVPALLAGCAKPAFEIAEPGGAHRAAADTVLQDTVIAPSRNVSRLRMAPTVYRVVGRVRRSALRICRGLELPEAHRCALSLRSDVKVHLGEPGINAFADRHNNIGINAGLVRAMGSDAEIAAVLAHEFAHVVLGHVDRKTQNMMAGALIGGGLAGLVQGLTHRKGRPYDASLVKNVVTLGAGIGSKAYSPEMEIEADRMAIYILRDAGFPPAAMRNVVVRLHRVKSQRRGRFGGRVGFLQTHPSNDRRIAHILSAIADAENDVPLKAAVR